VTAVLDASALVDFLIGRIDESDAGLFDTDLVAPDLLLVETAGGLRRSERRGVITTEGAVSLLHRFLEMPIELVPARELVERAFEMRYSVTMADACYVALAEQMNCGLLTADRRLARAPGLTVPVTVI
jgi:predicted nucleic acid-binding protein